MNFPSTITALAPLLFVCLWATGFVGARLGMPYAEPGTFLALRFAAACALLAGFSFLMGARWPGRADAVHAITIGVLLHGVYLGGIFWAVDRGMPAGVAAVIVGLQPLLTAILAGLFLGETITPRHWIGIAFGIAGVCLVILPGLDLTASGITWQTVGVTVLAMVCVTLGTLYQKGVGGRMDIRTSTALQYVGAFIPVALLSAFFETREMNWTVELIIAMLWSILILSVGAIFLLMWLIRNGSVSKLSAMFFLVPAVAALMTYALFDETLTLMQLSGMGLCAFAVALVSLKSPASGSRLGNQAGHP